MRHLSVAVLNLTTGVVLATIDVSSVVVCPQELGFSPSGDRLYVVDTAGDPLGVHGNVAVIDTTTNPPRLVGPSYIGGTEARAVLVTPDNAAVYVANSNLHTISIIDI